MKKIAFALVTLLAASAAAAPAAKPKLRPLRVGVTLHPYFAWTANIAAGVPGVEVRAILPGEVDAGNYQPSPDDIKKLADLDALVVNGIGHDDFITDMVKASGNTKLVLIRPNDATPQVRATAGGAPNSHTFISFGNAIQQTYFIQKALAALRPEHAAALQKNAADYARRLRKIKAAAAARLADAKITRVVTVHDGYSYLLHELGIELAGVVEPAHGLVPSAKELAAMIKLMKAEQIRVVLSEESFPDKLLKTLQKETRARVYLISHVATGAYTADKFEKEMQANVDALVRALVEDPGVSSSEPPLVAIQGLGVREGGRALLEDVALEVAPGSVHVIVGPNGAGKSTLLACLLGMRGFSGEIRLNWRRDARIGYVPQGFEADRTLPITVGEFLAAPRQRWPVCLGVTRAARARVTELLGRVGLPGFETRRLGVLSGGELRRVLIANALEPAPELLVCDEPAGGLDPEAVLRLDELVRAAARGGTGVLMVSHDLAEVRRVADRVTWLDRRVRMSGAPDDVLAARAVEAA